MRIKISIIIIMLLALLVTTPNLLYSYPKKANTFNLIYNVDSNMLEWSHLAGASFYLPMALSNHGIVSPLLRLPLESTKFRIQNKFNKEKIFINALDKEGKILKSTNLITIENYNETSCFQTLVLKIGKDTFEYNGKTNANKLPTPCTIIEGRTMVVVRKPLEAIGAEVIYDETKRGSEIEKRVTVSFDDYIVQVWIGKNYAMLKEKGKKDFIKKQIDDHNPNVKPTIINGNMLLPLRMIAQGIGVLNPDSMWQPTIDNGKKSGIITLKFKCLEINKPCCEIEIIPSDNVIEKLEEGQTAVLTYKISNKSNTNCQILTPKPWKNILYIIPDTDQGPIDIPPKGDTELQIFVLMPNNAKSVDFEEFTFNIRQEQCQKDYFQRIVINYEKTILNSCCNFDATINPIDLNTPICEEAEKFIELSIKNLCKDEGHTYYLSESTNQVSILPNAITVLPNNEELIKLLIKMPKKSVYGLNPKFVINIKSDCQEEKSVDLPLTYSNNCLADCAWEVNQITDTLLFSKTNGEDFNVRYKVTNNSKTKKTFTITMNETDAIPTPSFLEVESNGEMVFDINCTMLQNVEPGDFAVYSGIIESDCNYPQALTFKVLKSNNQSSGCCDYTYTVEKSQNITTGLCPADTGYLKYVFTNSCTDPNSKYKLEFTSKSNVDMIYPTSIELASGESQEMTLFFTMPNQTVNSDPADISFEVQTPCGEKEIGEKITYSTCSSNSPPTSGSSSNPQQQNCCYYDISMISNSYNTAGICSGNIGFIKYKVKNMCPSNSIDFKAIKGLDITNISPEEFSLAPGEEKDFEINFIMPQGGYYPVAGIIFGLETQCSYDVFGSIVPYCTNQQNNNICCQYTATLDTSTQLNPFGYCPGDPVIIKLLITNTCTNLNDTVSYTFIPGTQISQIFSQTNFILTPGQSNIISFKAIVPNNTTGSQTFDINYILSTQCGNNNEKITLFYDTSGTCSPQASSCNWNYLLSTITPIPPQGLCSGNSYSLIYNVKNLNSNINDIITLNAFLGPNVTSISPMNFQVLPGMIQQITVNFIMPPYTGASQNANISFMLSPTCGPQQTISASIPYSANCSTCCAFVVTAPPSTLNATLACNNEQDYLYKFKNNCSLQTLTASIVAQPGSNIIGITPSNFSIGPNQNVYFNVRIKMPAGTVAGSVKQYTFNITVNGCQTLTETFNVTALTCGTGSQCTWQLHRPNTSNLTLCPGSKIKLTYGIENTSASGFISFNMNQTGITSPVVFNPPSLTVSSGETKTFQVEFTMDQSMIPPLLSQIQFNVIPTCVYPQVTETFVVQCQGCSFDVMPTGQQQNSICSGGSGIRTFKIVNKCDNQSLVVNLSSTNINISSITPNNLTILPGGTGSFTVNFTMPTYIPFGSIWNYDFNIIPICNAQPQNVTFSITNGCSWQLVEPTTNPAPINPGNGKSYSFVITNNCTTNLLFNLISASPEIVGFTIQGSSVTQFTVNAGSSITFEANFVMPIGCSQGVVSGYFDISPSDPISGNACQAKGVSVKAICSPNASTCDWSPIVNTTVPPLGIRLLAGDSMLIDYQIDVTSACNLTTVSIIPSMGSGQMSFVETSTGLAITSLTINGPGTYKFSQLITMPSTALPYDMVEFYFTLKNTGTGEIVPGGVNAYCQ